MAKAQTFGIDIRLGEHDYRVQPQRHAYLKRELRGFAEGLSDLQDIGVEDVLDLGTDQLYALLAVMIPDLMPKWEWDGYVDPGAAERDEYDREADRSPTAPEIKAALSAAIKVNEFDWVGQLKNFVGPDLIRTQIRASLAQWAAEQQRTSSPDSASLPQPNGESPPMSSGPRDLISPIPTTSG
jgi:hypothetical protein